MNRRARLSDNPGAFGQKQPTAGCSQKFEQQKGRVQRPTKTATNETTFGKFIPTEGPTFPGWPFSPTAGAVARQRIANLPATPSVAIRRRSYKTTDRGIKAPVRLFFLRGQELLSGQESLPGL